MGEEVTRGRDRKRGGELTRKREARRSTLCGSMMHVDAMPSSVCAVHKISLTAIPQRAPSLRLGKESFYSGKSL